VTPEQYRAGAAFHEAGHACAARALRVGVRSVSIVPDEASGGRVEGNQERLNFWGLSATRTASRPTS
jgi:hypothetical protein